MKRTLIFASFLVSSQAAYAADTSFSLDTERTKYTGALGSRDAASLEGTSDFGNTALSLSLSRGKRKTDEGSYSAVRAAGTIYHDWNDRVYTRTTVGVSSNQPVFATREVATDLNFKPAAGVVLTAGAKRARYFGNRDVASLSAGGSLFFSRGFVNYRFTSYDAEHTGQAKGHLATIRLRDGKGSGATQLWLGTGTSLQEEEPLLGGQEGKYRSASLKRVQPISARLAVSLSLRRTWYNTALSDYRGTTASVGLTYSGWRVF
jgi:YaiO family outer membrane protein